ncbi:MAG: LysR family transcriptional regulator, partial [Verrucomicrobiota bacterium]
MAGWVEVGFGMGCPPPAMMAGCPLVIKDIVFMKSIAYGYEVARPHSYTLRQLQYAVAIAEQLSFGRAAGLCGVSQPAMSAQVAQLEGALGVRLFERGRGPVLLTTAGKGIIDRARRVLVEADDLAAAGRALGDPLSGALRIGVIPTISPYLLPATAPKLRARFPRLTISWHEDRTAALVSALRAGDLDAALLALVPDLGDVEREIVGVDP